MEDASKKMHEYLERKQQRQEEFWLRRFGKVLYPVLPKPSTLPSEDKLRNTEGRLPPIRSGKGNPALFQAAGPIKSFPMKGSDMNPDRKHKQGNMPYHPSGQTTFLPPISHSAKISSHLLSPGMHHTEPNQVPASAPQELSSQSALHREAATASPIPSQLLELDDMQPPSPAGYKGHYSPSAHMHPQHSGNGSKQLLAGMLAQSEGVFKLPPLMHPDSPSGGNHKLDMGPPSMEKPKKVVRDVQMENNVIKSIKSREDGLDRLRIAGDKLSAVFGDSAPLVLSQADPLVRLFYRLVGNLRQRTLDAVECIAAWKRKTSSPEPFIYYGRDYLATVGPDLAFLDDLAFLRSRLVNRRAADDPFLVEVTPDGIPIEEATTCDLRRAGHRLTSDALRIRMARRAMAAYFGLNDPERPTSASSSTAAHDDVASLLIPLQHAPLQQLEGQLLREALTPMVHSHLIMLHAHLGTESEIRDSTRDLARRVGSMLYDQTELSTLQAMLSIDGTCLGEKVMEILDSMHIRVPPAPAPSPPVPATATTAVSEVAALGEAGDERRMNLLAEPRGSSRQAAVEEASAQAAVEEEVAAVEEAAEVVEETIAEAVDMLAIEEGAKAGPTAAAVEDDPEAAAADAADVLPAVAADTPAAAADADGLSTAAQEEGPREVGESMAAEQIEGVEAEVKAEVVAEVEAEVEAEAVVDEEAGAGVAADEEELYDEESRADVFVVDHDAMGQSLLSGVEELIDNDDGLFIDFAIGAMLASLEDPYVAHTAEGNFTVDGWEIDRQLDSLVASLEASSSDRDAHDQSAYDSSVAPQYHLRMNPQLTGGLEVRGASPLHAPSSSRSAAANTASRKPPLPSGLAGVDEHSVSESMTAIPWGQGGGDPRVSASVFLTTGMSRSGGGKSSSGGAYEPSPSRDGRTIDTIVDDIISAVGPTPPASKDNWRGHPSRDGRAIDGLIDDIVAAI